jgi:hypothetical protein
MDVVIAFSVDSVTHRTLIHAATVNGDRDGDSDGTAITVRRPQ